MRRYYFGQKKIQHGKNFRNKGRRFNETKKNKVVRSNCSCSSNDKEEDKSILMAYKFEINEEKMNNRTKAL